jgi:hypothetical protein
MRRLMACIATVLAMLCGSAHAAVLAVTAAPVSATVNAAQPVPVSIVWTVTANGSPVTSSTGVFVNARNGQTLGTGGAPLSINVSRSANVGTGSIAESLQVPGTVLQAAMQQGLPQILFVRSFQDPISGPTGARQGIVTLSIVTPTLADVSVLPTDLNASLIATGPYELGWTVRGTPGAGMARSTQGLVLTPSGKLLQIDPTPLSVNLATGTATAVEAFQLAPATVATALRLGANTLLLVRQFVLADGASTQASARIHIGGSASGPLTVTRISLRFDDHRPLKVVSTAGGLNAIADIDYAGSGTLSGLWEVAAPPSTQGQPVFVPMTAVTLNLSGGGRSTITSPPLPTLFAGSYYVRFVLRSPATSMGALVIEYAVSSAAAGKPALHVRAPADDTVLGPATVFDWDPVAGATAYRIEIYPADASHDAYPLTGVLLPGNRAHALLSNLVMGHLAASAAYRWQITAYGPDGKVLARSALRNLSTP